MRCKSLEAGGGKASAATAAASIADSGPAQNEHIGAETSANFAVLRSPLTSPIDPKEYRDIRLPNGLTALLVSYCSRAGDPPPENLSGCVVKEEEEEEDEAEEGEDEEEEEEDEDDGEDVEEDEEEEEEDDGEDDKEDDESEDDGVDEELEEPRGGFTKEAGNTTEYLVSNTIVIFNYVTYSVIIQL
ncbi:nucleolin-like [Macrobrachium nipponense]|uniref:nucleolin-like n=1 Tax=Macrobrachium nipponense TaxID=159736 RepID=UPI0030C89E47